MVSDVMEQILKKVYLSMSYWQNEIKSFIGRTQQQVTKITNPCGSYGILM